ncbi:MAG: hypothetical protein R3C10_26960 [Pirellulales bacterium]
MSLTLALDRHGAAVRGHAIAGRGLAARVAHPGRVAGLLYVHAEHDHVQQHLHVSLRLHVAPITPKLSHGWPSLVTMAGMIVWNGRLWGSRRLGWSGSSENNAAVLDHKADRSGNDLRSEAVVVALN